MTEPTEIEFARLLDWVEDRLSPEEARSIEAHMDEVEVAWLRAFVRASEDTVIESPPAGVRDVLIERFEARAEARAEANRAPRFMERIRAVLSFDSGLQPALGIRSSGVHESQRQLIYSSETVDVVLDVQPGRGGNLEILGQVLPIDESATGPFGFQLLRNATEAYLTATDELGMFSLNDVEPGEYEAEVTGEGFEVHLSPVALSLT